MKTIRNLPFRPLYLPAIAIVLAVAGCGGGGDGGGETNTDAPSSATLTGQFKDSNVSGLTVAIGGDTQSTDSRGRFQYASGDQVQFRVGNVVLGQTGAAPVVTLVDLVTGGSLDDAAIVNRARFLQFLDSNQNPDDGITIAGEVSDLAGNWSVSSFEDTAVFETAMAAIAGDVTASSPDAVLPSAQAARDHAARTQLCVRAGAYQGTYSGDDAGRFALLVSARSGSVEGVAIASGEDTPFGLSASQPVALTQSGDFVSGSAETGASFDGQFASVDELSGNWTNPVLGLDGIFSGARLGGATATTYRYTGEFGGADSGLFAFDISAAGDVSGVAYSIGEDARYDLTGTVDGGVLTASFGAGAGSLNGTVDLANGTLSGSWSNSSDGSSGQFSGDGCTLNPASDDSAADDGGSGGDGTSSLALAGPEATVTTAVPAEQCLTYGVVSDTSIVSASAEWTSGGKVVKSEDLPTLSGRTDSCGGLIGASAEICLQTCLLETEAIGPSTLSISAENAGGETITEQQGEYFTNAGPFNGTWGGVTVQESNCGDDGSESGTITLVQGDNNSVAVYGLTPNSVSGSVSSNTVTSNAGYSTTTYSGIFIEVSEWMATLVGDDQLEGSASFATAADSTISCSGSFSFSATRQ